MKALEYLIKDSKASTAKERKYQMENLKDEEYYWKSRQGKDEVGNNTCHLVYNISDIKTRSEILTLLINEEIGDPYKRNKLGYLPH